MRAKYLIAFALAALWIAGCSVERPPGDGPLRYRDQVFSNVSAEYNALINEQSSYFLYRVLDLANAPR
jgi:hypothetical protein